MVMTTPRLDSREPNPTQPNPTQPTGARKKAAKEQQQARAPSPPSTPRAASTTGSGKGGKGKAASASSSKPGGASSGNGGAGARASCGGCYKPGSGLMVLCQMCFSQFHNDCAKAQGGGAFGGEFALRISPTITHPVVIGLTSQPHTYHTGRGFICEACQ